MQSQLLSVVILVRPRGLDSSWGLGFVKPTSATSVNEQQLSSRIYDVSHRHNPTVLEIDAVALADPSSFPHSFCFFIAQPPSPTRTV